MKQIQITPFLLRATQVVSLAGLHHTSTMRWVYYFNKVYQMIGSVCTGYQVMIGLKTEKVPALVNLAVPICYKTVELQLLFTMKDAALQAPAIDRHSYDHILFSVPDRRNRGSVAVHVGVVLKMRLWSSGLESGACCNGNS